MTEAERYLMYIRQITADWNKLVGECGRLEQENRELREKLTAAAKGGIIEERSKTNYIQLDNGRMAGSYYEGGGPTGGNKSVDKSVESGIMEAEKEGLAENNVHYVGKIDRKIYSCITEDITTDEVIITDERIQHIKERHPNDYERFSSYIPQIISKPDYIVESDRMNTAVVLKQIVDNGEKFKLILRLKTSIDELEYKNSVISFLKIRNSDWNRILRNQKILYSQLDKKE